MIPLAELGQMLLGFKIMARKDSQGYFVTEPSFYVEQEDKYHPYFTIDSNIAKDQITDFIRSHVSPLLNAGGQQGAPQQQSAQTGYPAMDRGAQQQRIAPDNVPF